MLYKRFPLPQITGQETANGAFLALAIFVAIVLALVVYVKICERR